jgi:hypothetical protein
MLEFSLSGGIVDVVVKKHEISTGIYNGNFRMSGKSGHVFFSEFRKIKLSGEEYKTPVSKNEREMVTNILEKDVLDFYKREYKMELEKYIQRITPIFEKVQKLCPDYQFEFNVSEGFNVKFVTDIFEIDMSKQVLNNPGWELQIRLPIAYQWLANKMEIGNSNDDFYNQKDELKNLCDKLDKIENAKRLGVIIAESVNALKPKIELLKQLRKLELEREEERNLIMKKFQKYDCLTEIIYKNDNDPETGIPCYDIDIKVTLSFLANDSELMSEILK